MLGILSATPVSAWDRGDVDVLAVLPDVTPGVPSSVEGLTVGPDDNIYVTSFGFNATGAISGNSVLCTSSNRTATWSGKCAIANSSPHTLGLGLQSGQRISSGPRLWGRQGPACGSEDGRFVGLHRPPIANSGLNALTFDKQGNVYISDSFNGVIWKTGPGGGAPTAWSSDPLLQPGTGLTPPFGANGVEFNNAGNVLFVANTATHQIIQIPVNPNGTAGAASIFITGINAPDGIAIDRKDNLWVCANQEDDIIVVDKTGKVIAKLGRF